MCLYRTRYLLRLRSSVLRSIYALDVNTAVEYSHHTVLRRTSVEPCATRAKDSMISAYSIGIVCWSCVIRLCRLGTPAEWCAPLLSRTGPHHPQHVHPLRLWEYIIHGSRFPTSFLRTTWVRINHRIYYEGTTLNYMKYLVSTEILGHGD